MRRKSEYRFLLGILIWVGLISVLLIGQARSDARTKASFQNLWQFMTERPRVVEVQFAQPEVIRYGDPVFAQIDGQPEMIGRVCQVDSPTSTEKGLMYTSTAFVSLHGTAPPLRVGDHFSFHRTPDNIGWVIETMLPKGTRDEVASLITNAYQEHHAEITEALKPIVADTLRDAADIIQEDLRAAMRSREEAFARLGDRFRAELFEEKIVPLIRDEIWPIVRRRSEPLMLEIGQELWQQVSLWRFTWRALYDATPMTGQSLTIREFERFFDHKAAPILESHASDFIRLQRDIIQELSRNERVKRVATDAVRQIARDRDVQAIVLEIAREVLVTNERLRTSIQTQWQSPRAVAALDRINAQLDPTIVEIGALLFGAIDDEIAADFATVLRNRIMRKDNRWLMLEPGSDSTPLASDQPIPARAGTVSEVFPGREPSRAASDAKQEGAGA